MKISSATGTICMLNVRAKRFSLSVLSINGKDAHNGKFCLLRCNICHKVLLWKHYDMRTSIHLIPNILLTIRITRLWYLFYLSNWDGESYPKSLLLRRRTNQLKYPHWTFNSTQCKAWYSKLPNFDQIICNLTLL